MARHRDPLRQTADSYQAAVTLASLLMWAWLFDDNS
jgi:hypothetical protein